MDRPPKHPATQRFVARGLFHGLSNFDELEGRIAALGSEKERGDAFEVFVEGYIATQVVAQAQEVFPDTSVPEAVRKKLRLPTTDYGADGVYKDRNGDLVAYQVKFRTGRQPLSWRDLSTFFGLTEKADRRVVFTNSDGLSGVAEERERFSTTRGIDFDRLDASDFSRIATWLAGNPPKPEPRKPRPHQQDALKAIARGLREHDRATVLMACGTGKTLTALWAAEQSKVNRILVLVPSLALLRQTLHEWARFNPWREPFEFLCVCSDPTVSKGVDEIITRPEDTDFPVSTDPDDVKRFLARNTNAVQIVFSTYQSAQVVAEGMNRKKPFDLGIFDEAHKTAGREGSKFGLALNDGNLPITKRLFMTATPRHYDIRKKDKEGDAKLVFSMDDEATYGPVVHRLTFAEAARRGIICNYKVVISIVDGQMVNNDLLSRGEVLVDGDPVRARQVAHQIALQKAVEEFGVERIITFHQNVRAARSYGSVGPEGVATHLPGFSVFHVNGTQRTADREGTMKAFREAEHGLITNARCLTEGVDVPTVDMVAFISPRRSKVDIVQATGRAMRKAEGKTTGYVLVPLFLEQAEGETLDEALDRSGFDEVAAVLNAMQEQDDELAEVLRELRQEKGRTGGFDESRLRERVAFLGPEVSLAMVQKSVEVRLVERLSPSWEEMFGRLVAFQLREGHCSVPWTYSNDLQLARWVSAQRQRPLTTDQKRRLDLLGFSWDRHQDLWEEMFTRLAAFREAHGHCKVPQTYEDKKLASWVSIQRRRKKNKKLDASLYRRLSALGFVWDPHAEAWSEAYARLVAFKQQHGHCNVRASHGDRMLATWVEKQRRDMRRGNLDPSHEKLLREIGFSWNPRSETWERMFSHLVTFQKRNGHCDLPKGYSDTELVNWVDRQRVDYKKDRLEPSRQQRLDAIGFVWDPYAKKWDAMFYRLVAFKRDTGHCNVPRTHTDKRLAKWVSHQRTFCRNGSISDERRRRLNELGFE